MNSTMATRGIFHKTFSPSTRSRESSLKTSQANIPRTRKFPRSWRCRLDLTWSLLDRRRTIYPPARCHQGGPANGSRPGSQARRHANAISPQTSDEGFHNINSTLIIFSSATGLFLQNLAAVHLVHTRRADSYSQKDRVPPRLSGKKV